MTAAVEMTGTLTDYALMTEGKHCGKYAVRIDDKPYPVQSHVDAFLLRLQKNTRVDVVIKDVEGESWVSKIMKSKFPAPSETAEKMKKAGFGATTKPGVTEVMSEKEAADFKARADAAAEKKAKELQDLKERRERDEALLKAAQQQGNNTDCTSPKTPEAKPDLERINREAREYQEKLKAANEARKAAETPIVHNEVTVLQNQQIRSVTPDPAWNEKIDLIKATCARDCTNSEFELLLYLANKYKLDPMSRQIWAVKYGNDAARIFCGRDGYLEIAHRSGVFDGIASGTKKDDDGNIVGWCDVFRKDMTHPFHVEVSLAEFNTGKNTWSKLPKVMITKVAESQCLRRAFSISGMYCPEEMPENGGA